MLREFRAIEFVNHLIDTGRLTEGEYRKAFIHRVDGGEKLAHYSASSKLDTSWAFLQDLRDLGRDSAKEFLAANYDALGKRGTLDLRQSFSGGSVVAALAPTGKAKDVMR